jgi:hypothetical protein
MFLIYHELGQETHPYSYCCGTQQFEEHLRLAAELSRAADRRFYLLEVTFDDGHLSQYSHAEPLLERYNVSATFFVTAGWISSRKEYMQWSSLRELHSRGHSVQSHTWSHPMLTHCSDAELEKELSYSRKLIEDNVGARVDAISIPNGRWNDRVLRACVAAGYSRVFTSDSWWGEKEQSGARVFGRINVPQSMTSQRLKMLARGAGWKLLHDGLSYSKHLLRQMIGDHLYQSLWRMVAHADSTK